MRATVLVLACCLCVGHAHRLQNEGEGKQDDYAVFSEGQSAQSLIQLVKSAMSPVDSLKSDFLSILRKEPQWKNFAKQFMLFDHAGNSLLGVAPSKWLCKLLRGMASSFIVKDFKVDFAEDHEIDSLWKNGKLKAENHFPQRSMFAQWSLTLDIKGGSKPIEIEGEVRFQFASNDKLAVVQMTDCYANGMQVASWPEVSAGQSIKESMLKIREWIEDVQAVSIETDDPLVYQVGSMPFTNKVSTVVNTVKRDFANIFRKEPNWNIYAKNLTMTNHRGVDLEGLEPNQDLLHMLRKLSDKFVVRDYSVRFLEVAGMYSSYTDRKLKDKNQMQYDLVEEVEGSVLLAGWRVILGEKKGFAFWKKNNPLVIEGETLFSINAIDDEIKIDRVIIQALNAEVHPNAVEGLQALHSLLRVSTA